MNIKNFLRRSPLKQWTTMCLIAFVGAGMVNCSDDDKYDDDTKDKEELLAERFPGATDVAWSTENGLNKAEFLYDNEETTAWFNDQGEWAMTQKKVGYDGLPAAVRTRFESSEYKDYPQNAIYQFHFEGGETTYAMSFIKDSRPVNLYYRENGELYRKGETIFRTYVPIILSEAQQKVMDEKYPNAILLEARLADKDIPEIEDDIMSDLRSNGNIRINIMDGNIYKEIIFNNDMWEITRWRFHFSFDTASNDVKETINHLLEGRSDIKNATIYEIAIHEEIPNSNAWERYQVINENGKICGVISIDPENTVTPNLYISNH